MAANVVWSAVESADTYSTVAVAEVEGVREADVLLVLLPGGFGTHVEIGVALALEKPIVIHAPDRETLNTPYPCLFHYHPNVTLLVCERIDVDAVASAVR
jgi:nucleoside 2-deoxyribosyltransferase